WAAALFFRYRSRVAWVFGLHRMPVIGLRVDHLPDHPIGLQLLDGLELRVPAQHKRGDALHLGVAHRAIDALHALVIERDWLFDHDVAAGLRGPLELLPPHVGRRT